MDFHADSVVFVTGAGGTVGRATILQFARDGVSKIAGLDIMPEGIAESEKLLKLEFPNVKFLPIIADLTQISQVQDAIELTVKEFGRLDHAVNNAGIGQSLLPTAETSQDEFEKVMNVNLKGVWHCEKFELEQMMKQDPLPTNVPGRTPARGTIVNVDSVLGMLAIPNLAVYTMSKHAVLGLTRTDALDYATKGIRINSICPGFIDTPLLTEEKRKGLAPSIAKTPMGRLATPQEVSDGIVFLSSERSSYVTGTELKVDGGYCIH
ncbi:hypothetical protein N7451_002970 [Penicillium sp. IBT 35674x]|nr:hypothetical protein N7451_002970 [Penicillium sp. IBT 35674x]